MSSNLSIETHPPSVGNKNGSMDYPDCRQDSPKEQELADAMITSDDQMQGTSNSTQTNEQFVIPAPSVPQSLSVRTRFVTNESRAESSSNGTSAFEEKVSLAPRLGRLESSEGDRRNETVGEADHNLQDHSSLFSLSGSMSSEFLEHQQQHPDHQQEYLRHPDRVTLGMNSPTSTTARDFLREIQCPSLPTHNRDREDRATAGRNNPGTAPLPLQPRFTNGTANLTNQRPPFHPPTGAAAALNASNRSLHSRTPPPGPLHPNTQHHPSSVSSHPTLLREHTQTSPSPTNTIPGLDGVSCDSVGRDKPVISRCFAWSQDSQDDRRITKRARTVHEMNSSASSPLSTDTLECMSPSLALETIRGGSGSAAASHPAALSSSATRFQPIRHPGEEEEEVVNGSPHPSSSSPTKVHWDDKVTVDPQVLFGTTANRGVQQPNDNEDVDMGDGTDPSPQTAAGEESMLLHPPIATAHSASHYSFESG